MYTPSPEMLRRYADVLVQFALNHGKGIKKGETVLLSAPEAAKPLYMATRAAIIKAGGNVIGNFHPDDTPGEGGQKFFYEHASPSQLDFFPAKYYRGLVEDCDHSISIVAETDMQALAGVDPKKIMRRGNAVKPYREWRNTKERKGKFSWTIALYGTEAMAAEAGLSEEEYWNQIIKACYLDEEFPVRRWREAQKTLKALETKLNKLTPLVDRLHVFGPDADLWIRLGEKRAWKSGSGANIPSFEVFTSPDWRGTEGWIRFNQPLYRYGYLIEGIELMFEKGRVVKSYAVKNKHMLKEMIATENADKVGEFSLTDRRLSRIERFMAETLYDENMGGPHGNTHIALGSAYTDCYAGDPSKVSKAQWKKLGYNDSVVHTDIISTAARTVVAHLKNGTERIIYRDGEFVI